MLDSNYLLSKVSETEIWLKNIRRDFHKYPELGFEEYRTRNKIIEYLKEMNIEYKVMAKTGIVGFIKGKNKGKTVALRADMDALPIEDKKTVSYKSKNKGICHACGHDAHIAILLGTAKILNDMKDKLSGNIKLIFQPAEETIGGAKFMIEEGVLENPKVDGVFGLHVENNLEVGKIGIRYGKMKASSDMIKIIIHGKSSHGAYPHEGIDAISIAAQVIVAIQTIVSRNVDPRSSAIVTLGTIKGGYIGNTIADKVEIEGIVRTLNTKSREEVNERLKKIVERIPASMGGKGEFVRKKSYSSLINDDTMVDIVYNNGKKLFGKENVVDIKQPSFGVEDFSCFAEVCPAAFFNIGSSNEKKGIVAKSHTHYFDIDEDSLVNGVLMQVANVLYFLNH